MARGPKGWRRIVAGCAGAGLALMIGGYWAISSLTPLYRPPALVAFYGGFALLVAAVVLWYRYVPPRPPEPEGPPELEGSQEDDKD